MSTSSIEELKKAIEGHQESIRALRKELKRAEKAIGDGSEDELAEGHTHAARKKREEKRQKIQTERVNLKASSAIEPATGFHPSFDTVPTTDQLQYVTISEEIMLNDYMNLKK